MGKAEQIAKLSLLILYYPATWRAYQIASALYAAGYRKLPERPKVLSDEELENIYFNAIVNKSGPLRALYQAGLDAWGMA